eukprot:scaffold272910_cov35-Attheya_sp.AAC.1
MAARRRRKAAMTMARSKTISKNRFAGRKRIFMRKIGRRSRRNRNSRPAFSIGREKTDVSLAYVELFENLSFSRETNEDNTEHDTKTRESNKIVSVLSGVDMSIFKPRTPA